MKSLYVVIKDDKICASTSSLDRAKRIADKIERKYHVNCDVAKIMKR